MSFQAIVKNLYRYYMGKRFFIPLRSVQNDREKGDVIPSDSEESLSYCFQINIE